MQIEFHQAECIEWMAAQPAGRFDLVVGSPPYEAKRSYGIGFTKAGQDWVDWMVDVVRASLRVCRGLVAFVVEGSTKQYRYSATPALLMADLHRAGVCLRKPFAYHRHGIPGGSPDFPRGDWEHVVCCTNGGRIPWVSLQAMGHPCKYKTGGALSYRTQDGRRVNESKHLAGSTAIKTQSVNARKGRPDITKPGDVIHCKVGKGNMGDPLCHENEAPFPERLAEFFIRTFCPPGGTVLDPFIGSGTTAAVCEEWSRNCVGLDLRANQIEICHRRMAEVVNRTE